MTATTTRSTPSLVVPSTQNTAPVLDFRCLYTYDLRRKAKRWQDGLARFHTFNKRVMVYDEPRNFIGDTHWREPEPIQDGDELQLDKGILIQIGEATGKTDQDISGLFEKRKAAPIGDEDGSPARTRPAQANIPSPARAPQAATSQLMPRTLNSVLGTPKGQLGRAALPAKSPFEQRHASGAENELEERAAKRQRVSYPDPRSTPSMASSPALHSYAPSKGKRLQARSGSPNIERIDNSKTGRESVARARKATKTDTEKTIVSLPQKEQHAGKPSKEIMAPKERNIALAMKKAPPAVRSQCTDIDPSEVISIDSSGTQVPNEEQTSQGSRLRIVSSKPRKKLMYRDLIPQANQTRDNRSIPSHKTASANKLKSTEKSVAQDIDPLSQFHHEERDRLKARLENHGRKRAPAVQDQDHTELADDLSLFVSQHDPTLVATVAQSDDEDMVAAAQSAHQPQRLKDVVPEFVDDGIPSSIEEIQPQASQSTTLAKMDAILLRRPKPPPQEIPLPKPMIPPRPIAKPVPQSDLIPKSPSPPPVMPLAPAPAPQPPPPRPPPTAKPLKRSLSTVISATTTTAQQSKRSLRKTVSDTAALPLGARRTSLNAERTLPPAIVEAAPNSWSREAWELFGVTREDVVGRATERMEGRLGG